MHTKSEKPLPKMPGLRGLPALFPGTVCAQYKRCGKPGCRCARGALHGPYYYHVWRLGKRQCKRYIRPAEVATVRAGCAQWQALQASLRDNRRRDRQVFRQMRERIREREREMRT